MCPRLSGHVAAIADNVKTIPNPLPHRRLLIALTLSVLVLPLAGLARSPIDLIAVAEQTEQGAKLAPPTPEHPAYYIAYDAGYIEAGDPISGLKPPSSALVGHALRTALHTAGYETATAQHAPSLVLVFLYGYIRSDSSAPSPGTFLHIGPNLQARLDLVAPKESAQRAVDYILYVSKSTIGFTLPEVQDTLDFCRTPRYFVIVSAYDYADLTRQTPTPLWRARLSVQANLGGMTGIVPALADASAPYLGRHFRNRRFGFLPPQAADATDGNLAPPPLWRFPRTAVEKIDAKFIRNLLLQERTRSSGNPR